MSPYRDPHIEITLPVGVKRYEAIYENVEALFSYSSLDGISSTFVKRFECEWNHDLMKGSDDVYTLSDYTEFPCRNGWDKFEYYVESSKSCGILKHDNVWIPWDRLDKILIVTREPVRINFLWCERDKRL